jgi:hypothetical protein
MKDIVFTTTEVLVENSPQCGGQCKKQKQNKGMIVKNIADIVIYSYLLLE